MKLSLFRIKRISEKRVVALFEFKDEVFNELSLSDGRDSAYYLGLRVHIESSIAVVRNIISVFHIMVMDLSINKWIKHYSNVGSPVTNIPGFNKGMR